MGQISGVDKVYYTENENATVDLTIAENMWNAEYTPNAKKYLIVIDSFNQGQTITFNYNMRLPQNIEQDIVHEAKFEVYNGEVVKLSKVNIYQEAERFDIYTDENIQANIISENAEYIEIGDYTKHNISISNISEENLKNVSLTINLPEVVEEIYARVNDKFAYIVTEGKETKITNLDILAGETVNIEITGKVTEYLNKNEKIQVNINYNETQAEISAKMKIVEPSLIETTITSNKMGKTLEPKEKIEYLITLKNKGQSHSHIDINIPEASSMFIQEIKYINKTTGKTSYISSGDLTGEYKGIEINPEEVVEVYVKGTVKELKKESTLTMFANITGDNIYQTSTSKLVNTVNKKEEEVKEFENVTEDIQTLTNNIQGVAWIDRNQNGRQDDKEVLLKGIKATLINTESTEKVATQTTNSNGEYIFKNIPQGNYIVEFQYNTKSLSITNYKEEEVEDELDSDVVNTTQKNEVVAKTEVFSLASGKTENINAGFVINKTFDMSITKGITKVTVDNKQGTNTYNFDNKNIAKVEIDGEYLKGSLILVEYEISVTNTGEVEGYAKLISDKIPKGMKFNSELNTSWYEESDGTLHTVALANRKLQPGETATIKLVLTKEMLDDKIVSPVNTVQIEQTFNEYLIEDKNQDNNSSEATIIISLTTGKAQSYIGLGLIIITIIGAGIYGTKKVTNKSIYNLTNKERRK